MNKLQHPFKSPNFIHSVRHALTGLLSVLRTERNFQTHMVLTALVVLVGLYFQVNRGEWIILIFCMALMMAVETLNTAIEHLIDLCLGDTYNEKAKRIKDISAGACLITAIGVGIIGTFIFWPYMFHKST